MKKKLIIVAVGALVVCGLLLSSGALAGKSDKGMENGNGMPSGQHYDLNIIGAKNVGNVGNGNSMGHTLFVYLYNDKGAGKITSIYMTQATDGVFQVTDRNGLDDGRAEFNIAPGRYDVYARALGKPSKEVTITSWGLFADDTGDFIYLDTVDILREKRNPVTVKINKLFCVDVDLVVGGVPVSYDNEWVFDIPEFQEYFWDYDNKGLKLLQVRFYENPDACEPEP